MQRMALLLILTLLVLLPATSLPADTLLRVATFNIANGQGKVNDSKSYVGDRYLKQCRDLLQGVDADLIGLQEVARHRFTTRWRSLDKWFAKELGMNVYWAEAKQVLLGLFLEQGNAVLSRFPIVESKKILYKSRGTTGGAASETRCAAIAWINVGGQKIVFVSTHLGFPEEARIGQARELLAALKEIREPIILVGDFNTPIGSPSYKLLAEHFTDAWVPTEKEPEKVTIFSGKGIDHIFFTPDRFRVREHRIIKPGTATDHYLVQAVLELIEDTDNSGLLDLKERLRVSPLR